MKFAHLSDIHIGGWREERLKKANLEAFKKAIDVCIEKKVAFILLSGDFFDTAIPQIEMVKEATAKLKEAKDHDIDIYAIPGSHDFSPSNKTIIDVLEKTGLLENVVKFKEDNLQFTTDKTGVKITGLPGKRGGLEKYDYSNLKKSHLEEEKGFKIFMFHSLLNELKLPDLEMVEGCSIRDLPKGFDYYAGGHPHFTYSQNHEGYGLIAYPGALFPNNFKELEKFHHGGFFILDNSNGNLNSEFIPCKVKDVLTFFLDAEEKTVPEINSKLSEILNNRIEEKIITIRIEGTIKEGKLSDIQLREIIQNLYEKGAYAVLKNTSKLTTKEFEETKIEASNVEEIEEKIIQANIGKKQIPFNEIEMVHWLIANLNHEKADGERRQDFEERVVSHAIKVLKLEEV
ncbi:MAG: DNA repair exonuclease [Candidatus Woesearchaeota archaeon]|nr:MAG: DNA repair exonuclease [Candidatus Woesearchaeota archaeon]